MSDNNNSLPGVEAFTFDCFGTVFDWLGSGSREVEALAKSKGYAQSEDWVDFTMDWRKGFIAKLTNGEARTLNLDTLHREILDEMIPTEKWAHLSGLFPPDERKELAYVYHRLNGKSAWPDCSEGIHNLKKDYIVAALSNGHARLLVDLAKRADIPWDIVFSCDMLGTYKPNPKLYQTAADYLELSPEKIAMVATHVWDLRAAARCGFKTVYVRRPFEMSRDEPKADENESILHKEFDVVVDSFVELADLFKKHK